MLKALALFFMALSCVSPMCTDGCVRCDISSKTCLVCDTWLNYVLSQGRCVKVTLPNCVAVNTSGQCSRCADGFFLEPLSLTCLALPKNLRVSGCSQYNTDASCVACADGQFLADGVCKDPQTKITNCASYGREGLVCRRCETGNFLSADGTACIQSSVSNCLAYNSVSCSVCRAGFLLNSNAYVNLLSTDNALQPIFFERVISLNETVSGEASFPVCQPLSVPNCATHATYNTCRVCSTGFYLNSTTAQCVKNPTQRIANCQRYLNETTCIECDQSMYLADGKTCSKPVAPIANCATYNATSTTVNCLTCNVGFYLSEPNVCTIRTVLSQIPQCVTLSKTAEECGECATDFVLTSDRGACLAKVSNCKQYVASTRQSTSLTCSVCNNGFFYDLTRARCVKGSKDFCDVYSTNQNTCAVCFNKFYVSSGSCLPHDELYFCGIYDNLVGNKCKTCLSSSFLFRLSNECLAVTPIKNCKRYATTSTCALCDDNYYLDSANTVCAQIPLNEFCMQKTSSASNSCIRCYPNYTLNAGVCELFNDELLFFCASHNLDGLIGRSQLVCNYCRENALPMNYVNKYSCVENAKLPVSITGSANCLQFDVSANCKRCKEGFVLYNNVCYASCADAAVPNNQKTLYLQRLEGFDTDGNGTIDSYRVIDANVCWTTIENCEIAAPDLSQVSAGGLIYACVKCSANSVAKLLLDSATSSSSRYITWNKGFESTVVTRLPGFQCVTTNVAGVTIPHVRPLTQGTNQLEFCEYYNRIENWLGCVKCNHGYHGVSIRNVFGCKAYTQLGACTQCIQGYFLNNPAECLPVTSVKNCVTYYEYDFNGCIECFSDYFIGGATTTRTVGTNTYVISNTCSPRVADRIYKCATYSLSSEVCLKCEAGYVLDSASLICRKFTAYCKTDTDNAGGCTLCLPGYYLDTVAKVCHKGEVANCSVYTNSAAPGGENVCTTCENRFYLSNNACLPHVAMPGCKTTHSTLLNTCLECETNYFKFTVDNTCDPAITISNCSSYDTIYTCQTCADGYYLSNYRTRCLAIPASSGCLIVNSSNQCTSCKPGYFLLSNACVNYYSDVATNCHPTLGFPTSVVKNLQECAYCATNPADGSFFYEPLDLKNSVRCSQPSVIKASLGTPTLIDNCKRYGLNGLVFSCVECQAPYILANDQLSCITDAQCFTTPGMSVFLSTYVTKAYNTVIKGGLIKQTGAICAAALADDGFYSRANCYLAPSLTQSSSQDPISYYCSKCRDGYLPAHYDTRGAPNFKVDGRLVHQMSIGDVVTPYTVYPAVTCRIIPATRGMVTGYLMNNATVAHCQYYSSSQNQDQGPTTNMYSFGCASCQWGFRGLVEANGYISKCVPLSDCNLSTRFENVSPNYKNDRSTLNLFYNTLFNCHACTDAAKRPTLFINIDATTGLPMGYIKFYNETTYVTTQSVTNSPYGYDFNCESPSAVPMLGLYEDVPGCQLWVMPTNYMGTPSKAFCVSCSSGFTATFDATMKAKVTTCTAFVAANTVAAVPPILNQGVCASGKVFKYTVTAGVGSVDFTQCITFPDAMCYTAASETGNCEACVAGATLNTSATPYTCQKITVPGCNSVTSTDAREKALGALGLYLGNDIGTCSACDGGLIPALGVTLYGGHAALLKQMACVKSTKRLSPVVLPTIPNCSEVRYNLVNDKYQCTVCSGTWVLALDGLCADPVLVPNCLLANTGSGTICNTCMNNFESVSGRCVAKSDPNCLKYYDSTQAAYLRCETCKDNFYELFDVVASTSLCVDASVLKIPNCLSYSTMRLAPYTVKCATCTSNYFPLETADGVNICYPRSSDIMSCQTFDPTVKSSGTLTCTKCIAPVNAPNALLPWRKYSVCVPYAQDANCKDYGFYGLVSTYHSQDYKFNCATCNTGYYYDEVAKLCTARTVLTDLCKTYNPKADKCDECVDNYYIDATKTSCIPTAAVRFSGSNFSAFLGACSPMNSCTTDYIHGLTSTLSAYVSCHRCLNSREIPFVFVRGGVSYTNILGLVDYNLNPGKVGASLDYGIHGHSVSCLAPQASTFSLAATAFAFPANCAIGVVNANSPLDASQSSTATAVDLKKIAVFCGACQPGYKGIGGTYSTNNGPAAIPHFLSSCTTIANCEYSIWFNYCTQCAPGFTWLWAAATGIQYDVCTPVTNNNDCLAYDPSTKLCMYCKDGTVMNKDNFCERLRAPRCNAGSYASPQLFNTRDISAALRFRDRVTGCFECETGFTPVLNGADRYVCTESMYQARNMAPATTTLLQNCKNYFVDSDGVLKCKSCRNNWIPVVGYGQCISAPTLLNCLIAVDSNTCKTCLDGFVLVNRACQRQNIVDCETYLNSDDSIIQICLKCREGYYLEANFCFLGGVANCLIYETKTRCNICKPNFQLVIKNEGANYCYPIDPQLKCSAFDADEFQKANLVCTTCSSPLMVPGPVPVAPAVSNRNFCMRFTQIINCAVYDVETTIQAIADSGFTCFSCTENFYLSNGYCVLRTLVSSDCVTYSRTSDGCAVCKDQMFVNADGGCTPFNSGIIGCVEYKEDLTCVTCDSAYYPSRGSCEPVPVASQIPHCINYELLTVCRACEAGYIIQGTTCVQILAQNCAVAKNARECESCATGRILTSVGTLINCVEANIANCVEYEMIEPPRCNICQTGFYADSTGACIQVDNAISRCLIYDSATTCAKCQSDTALSTSKTACLTQTQTFNSIDLNCSSSTATAAPMCSLCAGGYYLDAAGQCAKCSSLMTGCFNCNPNSPTVCFLCQSGYFMNEDGKCVISSLLVDRFKKYPVASTQ